LEQIGFVIFANVHHLEMEVEEVMLAFIFHVTAVGRQGWMIDD
jgi:hypothetical protein